MTALIFSSKTVKQLSTFSSVSFWCSFSFPSLSFPFRSFLSFFPFLSLFFVWFLFFFLCCWTLKKKKKEVSNWREMEARPAKGWKSIIWMPVNLLWTIMSPMTKESKREPPYLAVQYNTMNWLNAVLDFIGAVSN